MQAVSSLTSLRYEILERLNLAVTRHFVDPKTEQGQLLRGVVREITAVSR
jgi:hypothetical protein